MGSVWDWFWDWFGLDLGSVLSWCGVGLAIGLESVWRCFEQISDRLGIALGFVRERFWVGLGWFGDALGRVWRDYGEALEPLQGRNITLDKPKKRIHENLSEQFSIKKHKKPDLELENKHQFWISGPAGNW